MEDRGAADGFAVGRGAPAVSGLVVALHWQEVAVWMALWHKDGSGWTHVAPTVLGLPGLALCQLAFGQTWILNAEKCLPCQRVINGGGIIIIRRS